MEKRSGFKWSIVGMSPSLAKHQFIISEGKHEGKHSALFLSCFYPPKQFSGCFEVPACWVWIGFPAIFSFATGYFPLLLNCYEPSRKENQLCNRNAPGQLWCLSPFLVRKLPIPMFIVLPKKIERFHFCSIYHYFRIQFYMDSFFSAYGELLKSQCHHIWANDNNSLTWNVGPFEDSPNPNHDSRLRENRVWNSYKKFAQIICHLYIIYISNRHIWLFHVVSPLVERSACFKRLPHGMAKADGRMDPEPEWGTKSSSRAKLRWLWRNNYGL